MQVHASTDHLAQLVYDVARYRVPVVGSFESTLKIGGTYKSPTFLAGFDASNVVANGIPIAALFGEVRVARRALVLSDAGATFTHGEATLAGSIPLELSPLRLAAPDEPISFDLDVVGLDPGILDAALGNNTKLAGTIDGHVGLSGTIARPEIVGRVELTNGSYVSDLERAPISQIAAAIVFNHSAATLQRASARLGSGTLAASGDVGFSNGFSAGGATLAFTANARGAQLDLPAYGNGTLDGRLSLTKKPSSEALLAGNATLSNATLSFASFLKAAQGSGVGRPPAAARIQPARDGRQERARAGQWVRRGSRYRRRRFGRGGGDARRTDAGRRLRFHRRHAHVFRSGLSRAARQRAIQCRRRRAADAQRGRNDERRQPRSRPGSQSIRQRPRSRFASTDRFRTSRSP